MLSGTRSSLVDSSWAAKLVTSELTGNFGSCLAVTIDASEKPQIYNYDCNDQELYKNFKIICEKNEESALKVPTKKTMGLQLLGKLETGKFSYAL